MKTNFFNFPHLLFWFKSIFYLLCRGGRYGRTLRAHRDPAYVHERDKHPIRHKHHGSGGWSLNSQEGLIKRDYGQYEEYLVHQKLKFDESIKMRGGFSSKQIFCSRLTFYSRFKHLVGLLSRDAAIVCCGARQGTEVEVMRDLGFINSVGIDINPGPANPFVGIGDMLYMDYPNNSLDLIYTNSVDHAFDLDRMIEEHARCLKPGGFLLYDISIDVESGGGAFEAISWSRSEDVVLRILQRFKRMIRVERTQHWLWILVKEKK